MYPHFISSVFDSGLYCLRVILSVLLSLMLRVVREKINLEKALQNEKLVVLWALNSKYYKPNYN